MTWITAAKLTLFSLLILKRAVGTGADCLKGIARHGRRFFCQIGQQAALWSHYPLATASGRCDVSGTPGAWVVALTSGVCVAALPSYGGVLSYIIHHAFFCRANGSAGKSTVVQRRIRTGGFCWPPCSAFAGC